MQNISFDEHRHKFGVILQINICNTADKYLHTN